MALRLDVSSAGGKGGWLTHTGGSGERRTQGLSAQKHGGSVGHGSGCRAATETPQARLNTARKRAAWRFGAVGLLLPVFAFLPCWAPSVAAPRATVYGQRPAQRVCRLSLSPFVSRPRPLCLSEGLTASHWTRCGLCSDGSSDGRQRRFRSGASSVRCCPNGVSVSPAAESSLCAVKEKGDTANGCVLWFSASLSLFSLSLSLSPSRSVSAPRRFTAAPLLRVAHLQPIDC